MNMRVDLLLDTERRSASAMNLRSIVRIAKIGLPAVGVLACAMLFVNWTRERNEFQIAENTWADLEPRLKAAEETATRQQEHKRLLAEFRLWREANRPAGDILETLMLGVPPGIQLRRLTFDQPPALENEKTAVRTGLLLMEGKAAGGQADTSVEALRAHMVSHPVCTGLTARADVTAFDADPLPGADKDDRFFRIEVVFGSRPLE